MVWEVEGSTKRQLLFYPGKYLECYTGWTWLSEERLRAFHLAEGGLWITDINPHGTEKSETHYTRAELLDMKSKADTEGPPWAEKGSRLPEAEPAGK